MHLHVPRLARVESTEWRSSQFVLERTAAIGI